MLICEISGNADAAGRHGQPGYLNIDVYSPTPATGVASNALPDYQVNPLMPTTYITPMLQSESVQFVFFFLIGFIAIFIGAMLAKKLLSIGDIMEKGEPKLVMRAKRALGLEVSDKPGHPDLN